MGERWMARDRRADPTPPKDVLGLAKFYQDDVYDTDPTPPTCPTCGSDDRGTFNVRMSDLTWCCDDPWHTDPTGTPGGEE